MQADFMTVVKQYFAITLSNLTALQHFYKRCNTTEVGGIATGPPFNPSGDSSPSPAPQALWNQLATLKHRPGLSQGNGCLPLLLLAK